ncbi:hypothetical protein LTS14_002309 [Recurvomyces mirabilis]|nr:hypothetical protein LTS14_002309 [Recurvomyces mirabilis]
MLIVFLQVLLEEAKADAADIGIITMYGEVVRRIEQQLRAHNIRNVQVAKARSDPEASTVDAFQGRQKKIILLLFVAAFANRGRDPFGFVKDANRLNVATTRSEEFHFMFGDLDMWKTWMVANQTLGLSSSAAIQRVVNWVISHGQVVDWMRVNAALHRRYPGKDFEED